ncbi:hypothetical protein [Paenibacillus cisolokensis]|nr:hypothetical protein [Paenibacillus cisolokensis]
MADNTQESVEQLSDKIDVLLRQYDQFTHLVVFDSRVQRTLAEAGYGREEPDAVGLNRYLGERTRHIAGDMLIHLFDTAGRAYASTDALQLFWRNYDEVAAISWYAKMATMDGHMLWVYGPAWRDGEIPAIIGARKIKMRTTCILSGICSSSCPWTGSTGSLPKRRRRSNGKCR